MFTIGMVLLIASVAMWLVGYKLRSPEVPLKSIAIGLLVVSLLMITASTAVFVPDGQLATVSVKFGAQMPPGRNIATNGEKGTQAYILLDGWHFWLWPWKYDVETSAPFDVPSGQIGVVEASDGQPLLKGEVYAAEWESPQDMLDGDKFLATGFKGPQLTVLPPGRYRFNPKLFKVELHPAISVDVGEVCVVKANAGSEYKGAAEVTLVNGVPMVPNGFRGIWIKPLTPNQYYMHPKAYDLTHVRTTKRVYSYTNSESEKSSKADRPGDNHSINVRTKDAFEFPIDVRAAVMINAEDAPYVVASIGAPDEDHNQDGFDNLEDRIILPRVRAVFRNSSETHGALEYVNNRSKIESMATEQIAETLKDDKVQVDGIYIADIGLSSTPEGKELLKTQTDREVATQEQETWLQKKSAAESRAQSVRADTMATQEAQLVTAEVKVKVATSEAEAEVAKAKGDAEAAGLRIEALGGQQNYLMLKATELFVEKWGGTFPEVFVMGEGQLDTAVLGKLLQDMQENETPVDPPAQQ